MGCVGGVCVIGESRVCGKGRELIGERRKYFNGKVTQH